MNKELDCRGLACPQPVMRCRDILQADNPDRLKVFVDNQAAAENVGRFLGRNGFEISASQITPGEWEIEATKGTGAQMPVAGAAGVAGHTNAEGKTLVLITTDTLGRGDDELGVKLMNTFLATLPDMGDCLWRIILLNGGVKLACAAGAALDSLKKLEQAGASVLVCGTCLSHFGLLEKKLVGETTNMLDVISSLALAQKIVRP